MRLEGFGKVRKKEKENMLTHQESNPRPSGLYHSPQGYSFTLRKAAECFSET
jgi:hypothetical protein